MENKLLKQSDIDSLVSELAAKAAAEPATAAPPPAPTPAESQPTQSASLKQADAAALPSVKEVSLEDARRQEPAQESGSSQELLVALNEKLMDRVRRLEAKVQKLEQIEKVRSGGTGDLVSTQQLQEVVKYVQQVNQTVANIMPKLQGTLGYDAYHSFQCSSCGAQERVATLFKCTHCGQESWRGW